MAIQLYNTLTRAKEPFQPYEEGKAKLYVCGPTVYDGAHIGHAMSYVVFDVVRRYLEYRGYDVKHVQNFTDVDDKIINRSNETGEPWNTITTRYIDEFLRDMDALNILRADAYPCASQEIPQIIEMIQGLTQKGYAYESAGDVYFRVERDEDYGKLSNRRLDEQQEGSRVSDEERERKEHPLDFALWKAAKPGEPSWESPWGSGRPGWHIECSAMSLRYLGAKIDIHGGGTDLIFPHHENEIAQSESYTDETPFVKYWMHNGHLQIKGGKMARSLGHQQSFGIASFLEQHPADALRLFILSSHYRRAPTFTDESFAAAERALERFHAALQPPRKDASEQASALDAVEEEVSSRFHEAMDDDFNSASALGALFELARAINAARDRGEGGESFTRAQETLRNLLGVLGFRLDQSTQSGQETASAAPFVELLVEMRTRLRKEKQWALADEVRNRLADLGVTLEDTPEGTVWKFD